MPYPELLEDRVGRTEEFVSVAAMRGIVKHRQRTEAVSAFPGRRLGLLGMIPKQLAAVINLDVLGDPVWSYE